jgi:DNA repair protein RadD
MTLRPYQQEAYDAIMSWVRKSREPCCIEAATGCGKSHIIAAVAHAIHEISKGKNVLCLAPSAELVKQNCEKYRATGNKSSIFSASAGEKSLRYPVVFGTPLTVKNRIGRFKDIAAIVIDECHGLTPTIREIIDAIRAHNSNVRVIGLTATPYRMNTGYIFATWPDGRPVSETMTVEPYFGACVYRVRAKPLIEAGYLTQPVLGKRGADGYSTLHMRLDAKGNFSEEDVDRAYHGQGRKTAAIIADIVDKSRDRQGVMIFAATVQHAKECLDSLPGSLSALVTGETPAKERAAILEAFKARKLKYLVNVSVLTTGFDAPHVDVIAMLRATESVGLLQQIIGRGLRISDGKVDCMILDYAENIERHCPDGDIFSPEIKVKVKGGDAEGITCKCPDCGAENLFTGRPNDEGYEVSEDGYFLDLDGNKVETDAGPVPAHYGRRCQAKHLVAGDLVQCGYRWTFKTCVSCGEDNDIAARYCSKCRSEMVDPNEKLKIDFKAFKRAPTNRQTDEVLSWEVIPSVSRSGAPIDKVMVSTPFRSFTMWIMKEPTHPIGISERANLNRLGGQPPKTITYQKDPDSGFYRVFGYNGKPDEIPS